MNAEDIVVGLIALHGGELVGRTRLQKEAYLLHRCGGEFDLPFVYHHYGPYSFDLTNGWTDARAEGRIEITEKPGRHGIPYAIFRRKDNAARPKQLGALPAARARPLLKKMKEVSDIVLELAATIVFLRDEGGHPDDAIEETKARKSLKATDERIDKALSLLRELDLAERTAPA